MANECKNLLIISGDPASLEKFTKAAVGARPDQTDKGSPVAVSPSDTLYHFQLSELNKNSEIKTIGAKRIEVLSFHKFVPIPKDLLNSEYYPKCYDWEYENWGVSHGAFEPILIIDTKNPKLKYEFTTKWGPPIKFLDRVSELYPDLTFDLDYYSWESSFEGRYVVRSGTIIVDEAKEIPQPEEWSEMRGGSNT
jgi:hypothetical protein